MWLKSPAAVLAVHLKIHFHPLNYSTSAIVMRLIIWAHILIFLCPLARSSSRLHRRGPGCDELGNVTSYSAYGSTFDIKCNVSYLNTQQLHVSYVDTFT